jgi:hypothetical protein
MNREAKISEAAASFPQNDYAFHDEVLSFSTTERKALARTVDSTVLNF